MQNYAPVNSTRTGQFLQEDCAIFARKKIFDSVRKTEIFVQRDQIACCQRNETQ